MSNEIKPLILQALEDARRAWEARVTDEDLLKIRDEAASKAEAERIQQWRANLKHYAPVAKWRDGWTASPTEAVQVVDDWMAGVYDQRHIALFGPKGVGKTIAAVHWVKHLVEPGCFKGNPVVWLRPDDVVSAVCHSYDPESPRLARNIVIDELGEEKREDFIHALCKLLDRDGHRILITSNLTKSKFVARYSVEPKLIDRLQHLATAFYLGGQSRRSNDGGFV